MLMQQSADRVWLLGASTGGLPAVKQFLSAIPVSKEIAFIYVQHIDEDDRDPDRMADSPCKDRPINRAGHSYPGVPPVRDQTLQAGLDAALRLPMAGTVRPLYRFTGIGVGA